METDKRTFYVWIIVLLANVCVVFASVGLFSSSGSLFESESDLVVLLVVFLSLSVVPVLISQSNNKWKNRLGYGLPVLLLLPAIFFIWDAYTCTGKFCGIESFFSFILFGFSAIISAFFYTIGNNTKRWRVGIYLFFIFIELILLMVSVGYFIKNFLT